MHATPLDSAQIGRLTSPQQQQQRSLLLSLSAADWGLKPRAQRQALQQALPHHASVSSATDQVSNTTPSAGPPAFS